MAKTEFEKAFLAGVAATKEAVKADIVETYEAWDQADSTERCWYVDELEVPFPADGFPRNPA